MAPPRSDMRTETEQERLVATAAEHARTNGYDVVDVKFLFEHPDGTLVVHFNPPEQKEKIGDVIVTYCDTPGTVCVMINRHTGKCCIPELL
jgi:hypothetical protein